MSQHPKEFKLEPEGVIADSELDAKVPSLRPVSVPVPTDPTWDHEDEYEYEYEYEYLTGFFELSTWEEDVKGAFGLVPPPGDWTHFKSRIQELQSRCEEGEEIKVLFAARHGEGEHNVTAKNYGVVGTSHIQDNTGAYAAKNRVVEVTNTTNPTKATQNASDRAQLLYPIYDPDLTPLGRDQARTLALALRREMQRGMPMPERWFVSPLKRTGETCGLEWGWWVGSDVAVPATAEEEGAAERDVHAGSEDETGDKGHGVPALVVENIREHLHVNACDARSPLSVLRSQFPSFLYPKDMSEADTLWQPADVRGRETEDELVQRATKGLGEVLSLSGGNTYISLTSHSGLLRGLYKALGVPARRLRVGEMNVLVVKVKGRSGPAARRTTDRKEEGFEPSVEVDLRYPSYRQDIVS